MRSQRVWCPGSLIELLGRHPAALVTLLSLLTTRKGWAVGRGRILTSADGGARWKRVDTDSRADDCWSAVDMVDGSHGCAVGQDAAAEDPAAAIIARMDSRGRWRTVLRHGLPALEDVDLADAEHGWAVGGAGTILHTTDGGATWQSQDSGFAGFLAGVCAIDRQRAWAAGATWRPSSLRLPVRLDIPSPLTGIDFVDARRGWVVGGDGLLITTTGGR